MIIKVNTKSVICFDLDDTLYNELDYLISAYTEIAKKLEKSEWLVLLARMLSMYRDNENVFDVINIEYKVSHKKLLEWYRNHIPSIQLFNGALELINEIKSKNGKLCVITDGRSLTQRNKLNSLKIDNLFDKIIISEEIGSTKPSIKNFTVIEQSFPNCSYLYIADNLKKDFIAPNQLGWSSIGLLDKGKNIHNTAGAYILNKNNRPKKLIRELTDIIVK